MPAPLELPRPEYYQPRTSEVPRYEASITPRLEIKKPAERPISDFFNISDEFAASRRMCDAGVDEETNKFYIREDVRRFLNEFAGEIRYSSLPYMIGEKGLEYQGMPVVPMYERSAQQNGPESREASELAGFCKMEDAMMEGYESAVELSVPKISDYSFAFILQRSKQMPNIVNLKILQYDEPLGSTTVSRRIMKQLNPDLNPKIEKDFLENPVIDPEGGEERILKLVGLTAQDIQRSQLFEDIVEKSLGEKMDEYARYIYETAQTKIESIPHIGEKRAEQLLHEIFNEARHTIKPFVDKMTQTTAPDHMIHQNTAIINTYHDYRAIQGYNYARVATVREGAGNCPGKTERGGRGIAGDVAAALFEGQAKTLTNLLEGKGNGIGEFVCVCGGKSPNPLPRREKSFVENGKEVHVKEAYCPHCQKSAADYAKMGHEVCD